MCHVKLLLTPLAFLIFAKMEEWQREHIRKNRPALIKLTSCHVHLIAILQAERVLNDEEAEKLLAIKTNYKSASLLYDILPTRLNGYEILTKALVDTKQSGAATILLKIPTEQIANLRVQFLGNVHLVKDILNAQQIQRVHKWLQRNLKYEDWEKLEGNCLEHGTPLQLIRNTIPPPDPLYIDRFLCLRRVINASLFEKDCPDVFVFKGVDRLELRRFIGAYGIELSTEELRNKSLKSRFILLKKEDHWNKLCEKSSAPIHLIKFESETEEFVLEATSQGTELLYQHLEYKDGVHCQLICEDELVEMIKSEGQKGVCICDLPGMGKSFLLANLARKVSVKWLDRIAAFIQLRDINLQQTVNSNEISVILEHISTSALAWRILEEICNGSGNKIGFCLFFDGLDEVKPECLESVNQFLGNLVTNFPEVKICATSRPVVRQQLEKAIQAISYDIPPFSKENQIYFLHSVWTQQHASCESEALKKYAWICMQNVEASLNEKEREITGIPLQCRLIAEVFSDEAAAFADSNGSIAIRDSSVFSTNLLEIYGKYMHRQLGESQCNFKCLKRENVSRTECSDKCRLKSFHVWQALQLIFPKATKQIWTQFGNFEDLTFQQKLCPSVLVQTNDLVESESGKLEFVHRTFAEYLVAEYLAITLFAMNANASESQNGKNLTNDHLLNEFIMLRENVVAYFVNALIIQKSSAVDQIRIPGHATSLTGSHFSKIVLACLQHDYQALLDIIMRTRANAHAIFSTFLDRKLFWMRTETILSILRMAAKSSSAAAIDKLNQFYSDHYNLDLIKSVSGRTRYVPIVKLVISRAEYEVATRFVDNLPNLQDHGLLYHCLEKTYFDDAELLNKKLEIAQFLLSKCSNLIKEPWKESTGPLVTPYLHFKAIQFLIQNGACICVRDKNSRTVLHWAATYMSESEFMKLYHFLLVGRSLDDLLFIFSSRKRFKINFGSADNNKFSQTRAVITICGILSTDVTMEVTVEHLEQAWQSGRGNLQEANRIQQLSEVLENSGFSWEYSHALANLFDIAVTEGDLAVVELLAKHDKTLPERHRKLKQLPLQISQATESLEMFRYFASKSVTPIENNYDLLLLSVMATKNWEKFYFAIDSAIRLQMEFAGLGDHSGIIFSDAFENKWLDCSEAELESRLYLRASSLLPQTEPELREKSNYDKGIWWHRAAENMSEQEFMHLCRVLFVGHSVKELLYLFSLKKKLDFSWHTEFRHARALAGVLALVKEKVSVVSQEQFDAVWIQGVKTETDSESLPELSELFMSDFIEDYIPFFLNLRDIAIREGDKLVLDLFVEHSEKEFSSCQNDFDGGPLFLAIKYGVCNLFQYLLSKSVSPFELNNFWGTTILHMAAETRNPEVFQRVLEILGQHWEQHPPPTAVASSGWASFLDDRVPQSVTDLFNWKSGIFSQTPLHFICRCLELPFETLEFFLRCGTTARTTGSEVWRVNIDETDWHGCTALMWALECGRSLEFVKHLVACGANWNLKDKEGCSVSHICAKKRLPKHLNYFLELGCNINELDKEDNNPLQLAISTSQGNLPLEFIQFLISAGVDTKHKNREGSTAADIAGFWEYPQKTIELLMA